MLVVGLWTGNAANANAERALRYWREVGGRTAAYYSIYHAKPVPEHFGRARIAAGDEWAELNFVGIDCEINMINADMVLESANLVQGDGLSQLPGPFDLILCNPPYVNAQSMQALPQEYRAEPELALAGGEDGMDFIRAFFRDAPSRLSPQGVIVLEIGNVLPMAG